MAAQYLLNAARTAKSRMGTDVTRATREGCMKTRVILLAMLLCAGFGFCDEPRNPTSTPLPFNGLTGTISELLGSRPGALLSLGSSRVDVDNILDGGVDGIYECDKEAYAYLDSSEEHYYEQLAAVVKEAIEGNIGDKAASVFVIVDAAEMDGGIVISFAVEIVKNAVLPMYIRTVGGFLEASLALPCAVVYDWEMNLAIDPERVLNEDSAMGVSIGVDRCSVTIRPHEGGLGQGALFLLDGEPHELAIKECSIEASLNWKLCDEEGNDSALSRISYDSLGRGEYAWEFGEWSGLKVACGAYDEGAGSADAVEIRISADDVVNTEGQIVVLTHDEEPTELEIRRVDF